MSDSEWIAVIGAHGVVGRRVVDQLVADQIAVRVIERSATTDRDTLAHALDGARVVVNAAAPLSASAPLILGSALDAGVHYVDIGGDQRAMRALYEQFDSATRRAGIVALPGGGLDCTIGDLAATVADHQLAAQASTRDAPSIDTEPPRAPAKPRLAVAVSYVFDRLALSAGTQRAMFAALNYRPAIWNRDRWEDGPAGDSRRVNAGELGERTAIAYAGGDPLAIARHLEATRIASYLSTTRGAMTATLMRWASAALPWIPPPAARLLSPFQPTDDELAASRFAVVVEVDRGFSRGRIVVHGRDLYRTTAAVTSWLARQLADGRSPAPGIRAASELFPPATALPALAAAAGLEIDAS